MWNQWLTVLGKGKQIVNINGIQKREKGQHDAETKVQQEKQDNISEILINKGMKSKEMTDNDKLKVKVNSILQVKQIPNKLI